MEFDFSKLMNNIHSIKDNSNEDSSVILNELKEFFDKKLHILNSSSLLFNSIVTGEGLEGIAKTASTILNNPVIIIDKSYKILAHSNKDEITDPYWKENIKNNYCSYDFIAAVKKMKSVQNGLKSNYPFEVTCLQSNLKKLVYGIDINNKYVGSLVVLENNRPFLDNDNELLLLIGKAIAEEMKKNSLYKNINDITYENLLVDLIEGNIKNESIVKDIILSAGLKLNEKLVMLAFDISKYDSKGKYFGHLTDLIHTIFPYKRSIYYNDYIVMLYNLKEDEYISDFIEDNAKDFLLQNNLSLGISNDFFNIMDCPKYYNQAVKSIELNNMLNLNNTISLYNEIKFYDLLSSTSNIIDYTDFCDPVLLKLKEYDMINNTDFYYTLYIFLKNNLSLQESSKELFIHRNTMRYKINKIKELTRSNLSDSEEVFRIYLSYKIMNYIEKCTTNM